MSAHGLPSSEHLLELLALRAVEGLNARDEAEVASFEDPDLFDEAASVIALALAANDGLSPMPAGLRARLEGLGPAVLAPAPAPLPFLAETKPTARPRRGWAAPFGWVAAAACLALAVIAWRPTQTLTIDQRLASLEARPGIVRTAWVGLDDAKLAKAPHRFDEQLTGEVVWDPASNEGFMVFEGLASNNPSEIQYQLWIFDAERPTGDLPQFGEGILSQRPVDGGVFDVGTNGRVVVPIDPKLRVGKAAIFAVTVEPPGGVVVSDRDIVTLAIAP